MKQQARKAGSDDVSDVQALYDRETGREHTRLERHQLERDLTWRYLDRFLPPSGTILEVGAATGRYTVELAKRGYQVTAVDLSGQCLAKCSQRLERERLVNRVKLLVGDARDLSIVGKEIFDAVLLMGPLYHLVVKEDRDLALRESFSRLKRGGLLFSAFISRFGILGDLIRNVPHWIEDQPEVRSVMDRGRDPDDHPRGGFRGYFAKVDEIAPLHEAIGFETLAVAGVEPGISADDESYNRLDGSRREQWLELLYELSSKPELIASSRHMLYVGRK